MRIVVRVGGSVVGSPLNASMINRYVTLLKDLKNQGHDVVAIVGGGPGCKAIMDIIFAETLSQLRMKLIGVASRNPKAVGYLYAQEKGICTTTHYPDLYKLEDLHMIIELTGSNEVAHEIARTKPAHINLMDPGYKPPVIP